MTQPEVKILSMDIGTCMNNVSFEQIIQIGEFKVRLSIKSGENGYEGHALAQIWQKDKLEWSNLVHLLLGTMKTPSCLYKHPNVHLGVFAADADELIRKAKLVLF